MDNCFQDARAVPHCSVGLVPFWLDPEANRTVKIYPNMDRCCNSGEACNLVDSVGKEIWSGVHGGQMWINGLLYERGFSNNCKYSCQSVPESSIFDDWISKELALQELICSEGSNNWSNISDASVDDDEIDILSTLAAVAAMFGEWCALEAEMSASQLEGFRALGDLQAQEERDSYMCGDLGCEASKYVDAFAGLSVPLNSINWSINAGFNIDSESFRNLGAKNGSENLHLQMVKSSPPLDLQQKSCSGVAATNIDNHEVTKPHDALLFVFPYLSLWDILSLECTCKTLKEWIRNDLPLWQHINVEPPWSYKITDETLANLASRAKGQLSSLKLLDCINITEKAVEDIVYSNQAISKLYIPGCFRVRADAVVRMVASLSGNWRPGRPKLKQLKLGNTFDLKKNHYEYLVRLLGGIGHSFLGGCKPQYYHFGYPASFWDDQRVMDVEECPKCQSICLVYDCTRKSCQQSEKCRACIMCIFRCEECGRCIVDDDYVETFYLNAMCRSCYFRVPNCAECHKPGTRKVDDLVVGAPGSSFVCDECCSVSTSGSRSQEFCCSDSSSGLRTPES